MKHSISGGSSRGIPDISGTRPEERSIVGSVRPPRSGPEKHTVVGGIGLPLTEYEPSLSIQRGQPEGRRLLREWWHDVLRTHDRYVCFATLLALTMDGELTRYVAESGNELDQISGADCLVIVLSETEFRRSGVDNSLQAAAMEEHIRNGHSMMVAELFGISCEQFPCLVLFRDIRSPEHILVSLKGMSAEEIAERMRSVFSTIRCAVAEGTDPMTALERRRNQEVFRQRGRTLVGHISSAAGKTFELAMEAWIRAQSDK